MFIMFEYCLLSCLIFALVFFMYRFTFFSCFYFLIFCNLSGCATLSKDQCTVGDWRAIGKADGQQGYLLTYFEKHKSACLDHKIKANKAQYIQGRVEGLQSYCKIQHQIDLGIRGKRYSPVCSGNVVPLLKEGNQLGYKVYTVMNDHDNTLQQISEVRYQLRSKNIKEAEVTRLEAEESRLLDQSRRLQKEIERLKTDGAKALTAKARAFYKRS